MNRLASACILALGMSLSAAGVQAQSYYGPDDRDRYDHPDRYGSASAYDYARVVRVDPVIERYASNDRYGGNGATRCYDRPTYVGGSDGYYRRDDGYYGDGYRRSGDEGGRTVATVLGSVVGAVIGSQVGGGRGRYVGTAVGSVAGGMAGREIYEQGQRQRTGTVRVCDPVPAGGRHGDQYGYGGRYGDERAVNAYDVTYEYAGRIYTTRTNYHPGDRIRVRVDVRPE